jgi:hypothetical protein
LEKHGREQIAQTAQINSSSFQVSNKAKECMRLFQDIIDSPKTLLIVRNAILTLLETSEEEVNRDTVGQLLRDNNYRAQVVGKLKDQTPDYWSEQWDVSWHKDKEPLLSAGQERITRRASLIEFWTEEWGTISEDVKAHLTKAF